MSDVLQVATPVCIKAPVVSGAGETEVLERITLDVATLLTTVAPLLPAGLISPTLAEVVVLTKKVTITDCEVFNGKILVNGLLHKDLLLKILPSTNAQMLTSAVVGGTDCTLRAGIPVDLAIDCPFGACVTVPGACPGDQCQVELACVDAEKELLIDTNGDGRPELFEEKVCIRIQVKAIRSTQLTITPNETNICPQFMPTSTCPPSPCLNQFLPASTLVQRLQTTGLG